MKDMAKLTEMVFIMDKSGSMAGLEDDTIGGFNSMIEKQKNIPGKVYVTTVLFDTAIKTIHNGVDIKDIHPMTREDYTAGGCTALLDAVGTTITSVRARQKTMNEKPCHTIIVIITDGAENASREYSYMEVQKMIRNRKRNSGWEFIFLGANIDAARTACSIGINEDRAVDYLADQKGVALNFAAIGTALNSLREKGIITEEWRCEIDNDFRRR